MSPGLNDVIDRMNRGTTIYLDHRTKSYKEVSAAEAREKIASGMANLDPQKKAMLHQMGFDAVPQLTKLGHGEIIAGYPTEKYSLRTGKSRGELWITQTLRNSTSLINPLSEYPKIGYLAKPFVRRYDSERTCQNAAK